MTAHRFPVPPARFGSAVDPTTRDDLDTVTESTLRDMIDNRDAAFDQSISSELSMYAGPEDVSTDQMEGQQDETKEDQSPPQQGARVVVKDPKENAKDSRSAETAAPSEPVAPVAPVADPTLESATAFVPSPRVAAQFDIRNPSHPCQRISTGKRGSIATLASVMTTGESVYEDALETPNETGDEDEDEDVTDYYASLPVDIPSTPPRELHSRKHSTPHALRSPFMDLNIVPASPASPRSQERGRTTNSDEKRQRRQSLQDPTSPTIIPLRRASASSGSAVVSPSRRHSSIGSLSGSETDRPLSPSSPQRDSRRHSFQLKPLVLTPQKTVITTGSSHSTSPSRRLSSDFASAGSRSTTHQRHSSYGPEIGRSVSPFGTTSESSTPPLSLTNVQGPNKRRSIGYFEPTSTAGEGESHFAGRRLRTASVDTGTTTETAESSLLDVQRRASSSPLSTVSGGRASPQMSDQEWEQHYRHKTQASTSPTYQSKSRPPSTASTQLLRGYAAAALVGSHFSPLPTPQQMSPVPESPLIDQDATSGPVDIAPVPLKHTKMRRPAKYDEHWNGEAFESSPELGMVPRMDGLAPAPLPQAARRPASPREFQATFASPIAASTSPAPKPIMIKAGADRRGSKFKGRDDVAGPTDRRESAPASLEQRHLTGISRRASAFSLHRLSKVISDEIRAPLRTQHLPTSTRPVSGLAVWPPPEDTSTKKVSAGPRLQSSPAASPQVDQHTPAFSPVLDNSAGPAPYPFRSKRPSLLPRDPRAHVDGADAFLDILLNEEPPPRPRRQSAFDGYDGDRDANRWSTSTHASTTSTLRTPTSSPHQGLSPKKKFSSVFGGLTGGGVNKHRKSVGDLPNSRSVSSSSVEVQLGTSGKKPITIGSHAGTTRLSSGGGGLKGRSSTPPDTSRAPSMLSPRTAAADFIPRQEPMSPLLSVSHEAGPSTSLPSTEPIVTHTATTDADEPVEVRRQSERASSPIRAKLALPPGLGDSPDKTLLQKGFSKSNGIMISPRNSVRPLSPNGRGISALQRQLERPISPTSRDSMSSALSSGSGSTTKATAHSVTPPASARTTRVVDFAPETTIVTLPPTDDVDDETTSVVVDKVGGAQQKSNPSSILIGGQAAKRGVTVIAPLHELPSATRARKQTSSMSLNARKGSSVAGGGGQMRDLLRSQVLER
ncbi:hypothetical protein ACM66B_004894 [Microbotryomycetes sp. NB124-2]